jgi:hypothetical protein
MVGPSGNSHGARRQPGRTYERVKKTWQIGGDLTQLSLADAAEPCRAPCRIAYLGNQKIRRDRGAPSRKIASASPP